MDKREPRFSKPMAFFWLLRLNRIKQAHRVIEWCQSSQSRPSPDNSGH
ncbi:hypothetical protein ACFLVA_00070 [Chloroflexota bacterium]